MISVSSLVSLVTEESLLLVTESSDVVLDMVEKDPAVESAGREQLHCEESGSVSWCSAWGVCVIRGLEVRATSLSKYREVDDAELFKDPDRW